jgi:hypothetical protein
VDQPRALLQLCQRVVEQPCVDVLFDLVNLLEAGLPVYRQDLAGELAPGGLAGLVVIGRLQYEHEKSAFRKVHRRENTGAALTRTRKR